MSMTNQEKQADEIVALQSIYDTKCRLLRDNTQYEILIDFDLVQPFHLRYKDKTLIIHYLPPFSLVIHYHDGYPSDSPPSFLLSCFYFSKRSLQHLCQKLDDYSFIKGEVCVYDWIKLIQQEIADELILDTMIIDESMHDSRVLNGYLAENADQIYQSLINYNNEQEEKKSQSRLHTCLICIENILDTSCIHFHRCGHVYCQPCLNKYVQMALRNGRSGARLVCPQTECQNVLSAHQIKQIIQDDQVYERYDWCPRCQSRVLIININDNSVVCDQCHFTFCKKCREVFHVEETCLQDDDDESKELRLRRERIKRQLKKDRKKAVKKTDKALAESSQIEKYQRVEAERELARQTYRELSIDLSEEDALLEAIMNSERLETMNTQPCPNCRARIEKNGGCPSVQCARCHHSFIWSTAEGSEDPKITSLLYHFSINQSIESIREELNKKTDTAKVSEEDGSVVINNRTFIGNAIVKRVKPCPNVTCQKLNVKLGDDNWIICEECLEHYCFLCAKPIKGLQHFQKKCHRHT